jgi:hypothetical protein
MLKKVITMAVLSIFSLSILLPACSKQEQAKTTRLYTKQEALKMYHKDQIPEKDGINDNQIKTRSEAIAEYQNRKNKGTQIQEKDHSNDNMTEVGDGYTFWNRPCLNPFLKKYVIYPVLTLLVFSTLYLYGDVRKFEVISVLYWLYYFYPEQNYRLLIWDD